MARKGLIKAVAYFRTSSMTNVGEDTDTVKRQRSAVEGFAKRTGYEIVAEYSDDGVKGADLVDARPGFAAMLQHVAGNGVRTVVVETTSRFARDLITQETGWRFLREAGITLIAADSPDAFLDDTPTAVMIRQILGSVSQFEKAMLAAWRQGTQEGDHRQVRRSDELSGAQSRRGRAGEETQALPGQRSQAIVEGHCGRA
jgi:DNA invertase Pin-like site-specific DNA recombinase